MNFRKSRHSGVGNCVEVGVEVGIVGMRDSKNPTGPVLTLNAAAWLTFLNFLKSR